jgi:ribosomal-protein-alanine N-acetyltransferase
MTIKIVSIKKLANNNVAFRPMLTIDVPNVYKVETRSYTHPWSEKLIYDCIAVGYHCWLIDYKNTVIGYAIYRVAAGESHLFNIAVDPSYHNKGIGRKFLGFLLEQMRLKNAKNVILEVRVSNKAAQKLYKDYGFVEVGRRKDYYPAHSATGREDGINLELIL